jgi:hypothetical protein
VDIVGAVAEWPNSKTDYSYNLTTARGPNGTSVQIRAMSAFGAAYALETLTQLARRGQPPHAMQDVDIFDAPAQAYRGLMVDVARHWMCVLKPDPGPFCRSRRYMDAGRRRFCCARSMQWRPPS